MRYIGAVLAFFCALGAALAQSEPQLGQEVKGGVTVTTDAGLHLNIQIIDQRWRLYFLNDKREVIEPSLDRAIMRGEENRDRSQEFRLVLERGDGPFLTSARVVRPPFDYWLWIILRSGQPDSDMVSGARFRQ